MTDLPPLLVLLDLALLGWAWRRRRDLFLRPSTWVLTLSSIIFLVPGLFFGSEVREMAPYALQAQMYGAVLVLLALAASLWSRRLELDETLLPALQAEGAPAGAALRRVGLVLGVLTLWYLARVPLRSSGLYALLFDPDNAALAREEALKLLDARLLQYAYLIGFSALSPLAFALLLTWARELPRRRRWVALGGVTTGLAFYLLLTGARVGLFNLALVGVFHALLRNRLRLDWRWLVAGGGLAVAVPVLLSLVRERGRTEAGLLEVLEGVGERVLLIPLLIAGWFVEFAQTRGPAGLSTALGLAGQENWSNLIALEFLERKEAISIESVSTPTAFFFYNFLYFGWLGLVPSLLGLQLFDLPARWALAARPSLRLPLLAVLIYFSVQLVQTGFGAVVLTHGYAVVAGIALASAWAERGAGASPLPPPGSLDAVGERMVSASPRPPRPDFPP